jgi:hypothetical protein
MDRRTFIAILAVLALPGAALAKAEEKAAINVPTYVQLPTLNATSFRADGSRGVVTVDNGLDVADPVLRAQAAAMQPRLRAAFNQFLSRYMSGLAPGAPPNADFMAREFQKLTDATLGKTGARFLIGSILMN